MEDEENKRQKEEEEEEQNNPMKVWQAALKCVIPYILVTILFTWSKCGESVGSSSDDSMPE